PTELSIDRLGDYFPHWSTAGQKTIARASQCINAKAETIEHRPTVSESLSKAPLRRSGRCFLRMDRSKGRRQQLRIHPRDDGLMLFAGLYESWYPERNQPEVTFTIVTCGANAAIAAIHDRMRVVLDEGAAEDWMNPREPNPPSLKRLLVPASSDLL